MTNSEEDFSGLTGFGRWFALATELPCAVISMLLVGQILGSSLFGPTGAIWGALLGLVFGFFLGVYGVYATIGYYEKLEERETVRRQYMPPHEEIFEDVKFELDDTDEN